MRLGKKATAERLVALSFMSAPGQTTIGLAKNVASMRNNRRGLQMSFPMQ
jgi:hypothetical protein